MIKTVKILKDIPPIQIQYVSCNIQKSDTETEIYNTNKLTVLLTDGLLAVLDGKIIGGKKGDVLVFAPDEIHFGRFLHSGEHRFIEFYFPKEFLEYFCIDLNEVSSLFHRDATRINCIRAEGEQHLKIIKLAEEAASLVKEDNNEFTLFTLVLQILNFAAEHYSLSQKRETDFETPPQVQKTIEYINKNFSQKITLNDLAKYCNCSVAYLSRQFKKYMGITIYNYITYYRLNYSVSLLRANYSVSQAAILSGFDDCSNYINTFKKEFATTPYKYKNKI